VRAGDAERFGHAAGPVGADALVDPGHRLDRAHEHRVSPALRQPDHVEALVHAVDQKDVGVAGRAQERARAGGQAEARVAGGVVGAAVGLRLDDAGHALAAPDLVQNARTQERPRELARVDGEKLGEQVPLDHATRSRSLVADLPSVC
jgi:hypothetical protein